MNKSLENNDWLTDETKKAINKLSTLEIRLVIQIYGKVIQILI